MNGRQKFAASVMTWALAVAMLAGLSCAGFSALSGNSTSFDLVSGLQVRNPKAEAEAEAIRQQALDEAAANAIERQRLRAEAEAAQVKQQAEAQAAKEAQPALMARNVMIASGVGTAVLILGVGGAFAIVAWLNKRATSIYPDDKGMYPVIVRRGFGWVTFHDPNRQLSSAAVYRVPTVLDQAAATLLALRQGKAPQLPGPAASFPPTGSEAAMLQAASQAQAVGALAAITRPRSGVEVRQPEDSLRLAQTVLGNPGQALGGVTYVRHVDDPQAIDAFQRLLTDESEAR